MPCLQAVWNQNTAENGPKLEEISVPGLRSTGMQDNT